MNKKKRKTLSPKRVSHRERRVLQRYRDAPTYWRPRCRADCIGVPRPCLFLMCRYNLYLDVNKRGSIKKNYPDLEPWEMGESCALDVADRGALSLEEVGDIMRLTRERIRQVWETVQRRLRKRSGVQWLAREYDIPKAA